MMRSFWLGRNHIAAGLDLPAVCCFHRAECYNSVRGDQFRRNGQPAAIGPRKTANLMKILLYNPDNGVTQNFMPHLWTFLIQSLTPPGWQWGPTG